MAMFYFHYYHIEALSIKLQFIEIMPKVMGEEEACKFSLQIPTTKLQFQSRANFKKKQQHAVDQQQL